jgi:hypothetical protein
LGHEKEDDKGAKYDFQERRVCQFAEFTVRTKKIDKKAVVAGKKGSNHRENKLMTVSSQLVVDLIYLAE